jgi:hypothetical protein
VSLDLTPYLLPLLSLVVIYGALAILQDVLRQRRRGKQEGVKLERYRELAVQNEEILVRGLSQEWGAFLARPKFFYCMDQLTVESLYNQISPLARTVEIQQEISKETQKGLRAKLFGLGGSIGRKSEHTQKERKEILETPETKYDTIVRYLLENQQATLGLEDFSFDSRWEKNYLEACEEMKLKTGVEIPQVARDQAIGINRRVSGDEKLSEIRAAQGYALIKGRFLVLRDTSGFVLSYRHPVSEAVMADVRINAVADHLTSVGNEMFPKMVEIQAAMLARVMGLSGNIFSVKPIAVHGV